MKMPSMNEDRDYSKYTLNWTLMKRSCRVLRLLFPGLRSFTSLLLFAVLVLRIFVEFSNYYVGLIPSQFVGVILSKDRDRVVSTILSSAFIVAVASFILGVTKNLEGCLMTTWRQLLCNQIHRRYFSNDIYYKMNVTHKILDNADQRITQDVDKMTRSLIGILIKIIMCPAVIIFYSYKTYTACGWYAIAGSFIYIVVSAFFTFLSTAPIVTSTTELEKCEGDFRFKHTNVRVNAEAIALQKSQNNEWCQVNMKLNDLCRVLQKVCNKTSVTFAVVQYFNEMQDVIPYITVAVAYLGNLYGDLSDSELGSLIAANTFYMSYLTSTFGDVISQYEDISQAAGTIHRIGELFEQMDKLDEPEKRNGWESNMADNHRFFDTELMSSHSDGTVICDMNNVTVALADLSKPILSNFSFTFKLNENVLITGSKSCGKTTVLRLLQGLWKANSGEIYRSNLLKLGSTYATYVQPQTVLFCDGSLKRQIHFPEIETYLSDYEDDERILRCLNLFDLQKLVNMTGGLDIEVNFNWSNMLSDTEKKCVALARIIYHRPKVLIIDNIFDQISNDTLKIFYEQLGLLNATILSVGERDLLGRYHQKVIDLTSDHSSSTS